MFSEKSIENYMQKEFSKFCDDILKENNIYAPISKAQLSYIKQLYFYGDFAFEFNKELFEFLDGFNVEISLEKYEKFFTYKKDLRGYYNFSKIPRPSELNMNLKVLDFINKVRFQEEFYNYAFKEYAFEKKKNLNFENENYIARPISGFNEFFYLSSYFLENTEDYFARIAETGDIDFIIIFSKENPKTPDAIVCWDENEIFTCQKINSVWKFKDFQLLEEFFLKIGYDYAELIGCFKDLIANVDNSSQKFSSELIEYIFTKRGGDD